MHTLSIVSFILFFVVVIGLSVYKSRRVKGASEDSSDFFLGGRSLTWPLIGISIVAANISTEQMVGMAGSAAGGVGLAVSSWQLLGSVFIVIVSMTLLPRFLRAGIYTMPEFLEYRYNATARSIMAILTVIIYAVVMLPAVLYSGGVTLEAIVGIELWQGVILIGLVGMIYSTFGGLKAIAWADLVQGLALIAGGLLVFFFGLKAIGGWGAFSKENADQLHMFLPADNKDLPWTGLLSGMWIVMIYYCGLNQFIVQRNLAAKTLRDGQLGMIFAGALWLLVPFAIVMPGLMANQLYGDDLANTDAAFPTLIKKLIPPGISGLIYAAIAGAVTSTLASLLNSSSTIATMDIYRNMINRQASEKQLVALGRIFTVVVVAIASVIAPQLARPEFNGVFAFIQQFQGYIWPGVVAAFLGAFLLPKAPPLAGVLALVLGPIFYGLLQLTQKQHELFFLHQVLIAFVGVSLVMLVLTIVSPLPEARRLPVREEVALKTEPVVKIAGGLVICAVALFFWIFR
ncbi:solute:sodium symporter family transporter [Roseibacillus persicicus]|uniref:solute:sodium symporter family transporter n=1 Tax=Roseibacillus persicicus TaxID=454148 RepID=UPI00280F9781|nr:solute:sodium symporter family transporter [Roseibacillus persicicus]MDQ8191566.1 solute:sodium symporter family transporter [Roseibacillus persicicus]